MCIRKTGIIELIITTLREKTIKGILSNLVPEFLFQLILDNLPLDSSIPGSFRIVNGSVLDHWDENTLSWIVTFRRLLKEE